MVQLQSTIRTAILWIKLIVGHPKLQVHRHKPVFCIQIRLDTQLQRPNTSHYRHTIIQNNVELRRVRRVLYENDEKSINDKICAAASVVEESMEQNQQEC